MDDIHLKDKFATVSDFATHHLNYTSKFDFQHFKLQLCIKTQSKLQFNILNKHRKTTTPLVNVESEDGKQQCQSRLRLRLFHLPCRVLHTYMVHRFHVYQKIWTLTVDEILTTLHRYDNLHNHFMIGQVIFLKILAASVTFSRKLDEKIIVEEINRVF